MTKKERVLVGGKDVPAPFDKPFPPTAAFPYSYAFLFVIPSEAEGSAVLRTLRGKCFLESAEQLGNA
jgi:hypothetical protein